MKPYITGGGSRKARSKLSLRDEGFSRERIAILSLECKREFTSRAAYITGGGSRKARSPGFSITEILIALVIVAILAVMLTPNLSSYLLRANRSDAVKSLLAMQIAQEKYRLTHPAYAATALILGVSSVSMDGYYNMAVTSAAAAAYTLTATAIGTQTADTACTTLTLAYANNTTTTTPAICWQ